MTGVPETSRRVFVDTSAYFATANRRDAAHPQARETMRDLIARRRRLFTTNFILAELHALLITRLNREVALRTVEEIQASTITTIVWVSARDERWAWEIIRRYTDKEFSFTDATSFAVMERLHIGQAFSFDDDYNQYGFTVLPGAGGRNRR